MRVHDRHPPRGVHVQRVSAERVRRGEGGNLVEPAGVRVHDRHPPRGVHVQRVSAERVRRGEGGNLVEPAGVRVHDRHVGVVPGRVDVVVPDRPVVAVGRVDMAPRPLEVRRVVPERIPPRDVVVPREVLHFRHVVPRGVRGVRGGRVEVLRSRKD